MCWIRNSRTCVEAEVGCPSWTEFWKIQKFFFLFVSGEEKQRLCKCDLVLYLGIHSDGLTHVMSHIWKGQNWNWNRTSWRINCQVRVVIVSSESHGAGPHIVGTRTSANSNLILSSVGNDSAELMKCHRFSSSSLMSCQTCDFSEFKSFLRT